MMRICLRPHALAAFVAVAVVAVGVVWAPPASATVVQIASLGAMAKKADVIVHVTVTDVSTSLVEGRLMTQTHLAVVDGIKGAKALDTLVIHQIGGDTDGHHAWISGARRFKTGDDFVLFGMRWPKHGPDAVIPYGVGYGTFDVVADPSGALVVQERIGDVVTYVVGADGKPSTQAPPAPRSWSSMAAFEAEVRGLLRDEPTPTLVTPTRPLLTAPRGVK